MKSSVMFYIYLEIYKFVSCKFITVLWRLSIVRFLFYEKILMYLTFCKGHWRYMFMYFIAGIGTSHTIVKYIKYM